MRMIEIPEVESNSNFTLAIMYVQNLQKKKKKKDSFFSLISAYVYEQNEGELVSSMGSLYNSPQQKL